MGGKAGQILPVVVQILVGVVRKNARTGDMSDTYISDFLWNSSGGLVHFVIITWYLVPGMYYLNEYSYCCSFFFFPPKPSPILDHPKNIHTSPHSMCICSRDHPKNIL